MGGASAGAVAAGLRSGNSRPLAFGTDRSARAGIRRGSGRLYGRSPLSQERSMGISPNRLVAVLTPLVFAPLAGMVSVLAARHIPGLDIDSDQLQQIFIAGALI